MVVTHAGQAFTPPGLKYSFAQYGLHGNGVQNNNHAVSFATHESSAEQSVEVVQVGGGVSTGHSCVHSSWHSRASDPVRSQVDMQSLKHVLDPA